MNPPNHKKKRLTKMNAVTQAILIKLLLDGTRTCQQLADETGLHYVTVLQYTRELHRFKAAHITTWEKDSRGRDALKVYKLGFGRDAKRTKLTAAERQRTYKARKRAIQTLHAFAGQSSLDASSSARGL